MAFAIIKTTSKTWQYWARCLSIYRQGFHLESKGFSIPSDLTSKPTEDTQPHGLERVSGLQGLLVQPNPTDSWCKKIIPWQPMLLLILFIPISAMGQRESLENRLQQVASLIRDNQILEAEQQINNILKVAPEDASALNLLGTIRASQGKLNEAESLFVRALRKDPQLVGGHMNLAYLYLLKGAPERTISKLKEVLVLAPNNFEALYKLARLQLNLALFDDCIGVLENARQAQTLPSAFLVLLGDSYFGKGDLAKAEENYLLVLGKQSEAVEALLGVAQIAFARGDGQTANGYLSRAKGSAGNSPDLLYKYALTALKSGVYEEARSALEQLVKLKPDEPAYFLALGATWLKKPDLFEAEKVFRQALKLQPTSAQGQMYLGYTLLKQKNYTEARTNLENSIQSDGSLAESFYYLALVSQEQNEDARAIDLLQTLVERFPTFVNANVHVALGTSLMKMKDFERARHHLEKAVKLKPEEPKAHYNLALLYARLKEPERAQEEMRIVERLKLSNGQATDTDMLAPPSPHRIP